MEDEVTVPGHKGVELGILWEGTMGTGDDSWKYRLGRPAASSA